MLGLAAPAALAHDHAASGQDKDLDVGLTTSISYYQSSRGQETTSTLPNGFYVDGVELAFAAEVEPHVNAMASVGVHNLSGSAQGTSGGGFGLLHPEPTESPPADDKSKSDKPDTTQQPTQKDPGTQVGVEEAYLEWAPGGPLVLTAGRQKLAFGRHYDLHAHEYPFLSVPLIQSQLLSSHGTSDNGLGVRVAPESAGFRVDAQVLDGRSPRLFNSPRPDDRVFVGRTEARVPLYGEWQLIPSASYANGVNTYLRKVQAGGLSLSAANQTKAGKQPESCLTLETMMVDHQGVDGARQDGLAAWYVQRATGHLWAGVRLDYLSFTDADRDARFRKRSLLLAYFPSDRIAVRFEYDHVIDPKQPQHGHLGIVDLAYAIGAFPAHGFY